VNLLSGSRDTFENPPSLAGEVILFAYSRDTFDIPLPLAGEGLGEGGA
jgi:hypothetical protein